MWHCHECSCPNKAKRWLYIAFTDKVVRNCHFPAPGRNCYNIGKLILFFYGPILDSYRENLVALGSELCSFSREPGSDNCIQLYQWTHCMKNCFMRNKNVHSICFKYHLENLLSEINAKRRKKIFSNRRTGGARGSSVSIASDYELDDWVSIPDRGRRFFL
jgi:hypothetical protein